MPENNGSLNPKHCDFALFNSCSICNKALLIKDCSVDNDFDFLALTETWLKPRDLDSMIVNNLCPTGYNFVHHTRQSGHGGGVGLLFKNVYQIKSNDITSYSTFEYLNVLAKSADACLNIIVLYRPPDTPF